ncbi:MAG: serine/threonine-protein phosphatase [Chloroflexi bacterium]|nr:serine/threonine-protein phosphatase [Chloroflexota bacterium]MDA0246475.1 protein phosphatase 2C domain-containing protein [Chloroflexota bacterium]
MTNIGHIIAAARTDQGRVRDHNEDFLVVRQPEDADDETRHGWLFIVADGVGGADAGEVASRFAAEQTVQHYLANHNPLQWGARLQQAIATAHNDLCDLIASREGQRRMGTTLVAALLATNNEIVFANVGDSRAYIYRYNRIRQITKDHSLVVKLLEEGIITEEEAAELKISNIILQSIGSEHPPQIDLFYELLATGDKILLCSDGLNTHVADDEMAYILSQHAPPEAAKKLVELANLRGGLDNISVIVLEYTGGELS